MTNLEQAFYAKGKFNERGEYGINHVPDIVDFAQEYKILGLMVIGKSTNHFVAAITYANLGSYGLIEPTPTVVKFDLDTLVAFDTKRELIAYNNMAVSVRTQLGAYSTKFNVGNNLQIDLGTACIGCFFFFSYLTIF